MSVERLAPYLGIAAALGIGIVAVYFSGRAAAPRIAPISASSVSEVVSATTTPRSRAAGAADKKVAKESIASSTPPAPARSATQPAPVPIAPSPGPLTASASAALDASASALRAALVNVICYAPAGSGLRSISGSGVFVDPQGIILTNAHVAQYFLLADRGVSCDIRAGSPASDKYDAALIYIPPAWISANAGVLAEAAPTGTGEYDFAFLAVTKAAANASLPSSFPSISLASLPPSRGAPVVIASYGAQFLGPYQIQSSLFPTVVFGSVKDVFTFASSTIDVLALGGSAAAQEGSSGGGVAGGDGALAGVITTSTIEGATDTRSLSAITSSYIRLAYAREAKRALALLLAEPTASSVADFAPRIPALESILTANLH